VNSFRRFGEWVVLAGAITVVVADVTGHSDNPFVWVLLAMVVVMAFFGDEK
jgi:hypothetical protein